MAKRDPNDVKMSLGDHLDELRYRLILGLIGPFIIAFVTMAFAQDLMSWLLRPVLVALDNADLPTEVDNINTLSPFTLYFQLSIITGLVVGLPWLFYQLWKFIAPGLYADERKLVYKLIPTSALLAVTGVVFMYYVVLPFMLYFLITFSLAIPMPPLEKNFLEEGISEKPPVHLTEDDRPPLKIPVLTADPVEHTVGDMWVVASENELRIDLGHSVKTLKLRKQGIAVNPRPDIAFYADLILMLTLAFAVAFQTPMVIFVLGWLGIVDHVQLASVRKYAVLACVIVAAILTPTGDVTTLAFLAVPLYLLYELGILMVRFFGKRSSEPDGAADE